MQVILVKPFRTAAGNNLNVYRMMVQMVIMYVGLFYMTNTTEEGGFITDEYSFFNISMFLVFIVLNLVVFYQWMRNISINILKMIFVKNVGLFKLLTFN